MVKFTKVEHYGVFKWVRTEDLGKHRDHCLCWVCGEFDPDDKKQNCPWAEILFGLCKGTGMITPVWACPSFKEEVDG